MLYLNIALGIDIAKDKFDVALLDNDSFKFAQFENNKTGFRKLTNWLKKQGAKKCTSCMEATGRYGDELANYLYNQGHPVSVVNPARIKAYRQSQQQRNKTDREDAKVIAHFCATQQPRLWSPPPAHIQELQALTRRLEALKDDRTRELNRRVSGIKFKVVQKDIEKHIAFLDKQIVKLQQQIDALIDQHPDLRRKKELLTSIKGIGDITAAAFLGEVTDIDQFESAQQLAAYAGLTPSQHQSGKSISKPGRMSKQGNPRLRKLFYMPARSARRFNPIVKNLVTRMEKAGKPFHTIRGASMRKLIHLAYGVLKTGQPFDPNYVNLQIPS